MKKLILRESQFELLKTFLFEANQANETEEKLRAFIQELKKEFINAISNNSAGDFVTFTFGDVEKDGKWVSDSLSILTFKILQTGAGDGTGVMIEFVTSHGNDTDITEKGSKYMLYPKGVNGIHFRQQKAMVGFLPVDDEGKTGRVILIPEFISFIVTSKDEKTNAILAAEKAQQKWFEANKKFNKGMVYKPGFLGMDNFFFFPKGSLAIEDTLAKFGLSIDDTKSNRITIKIKNNIEVEGEKTLTGGSNIKGFSKFENGGEVFIVPSPNNTGGRYIFDVSNKHIETGSTNIDAFVTYENVNGERISTFNGLDGGNKIKITVIYK